MDKGQRRAEAEAAINGTIGRLGAQLDRFAGQRGQVLGRLDTARKGAVEQLRSATASEIGAVRQHVAAASERLQVRAAGARQAIDASWSASMGRLRTGAEGARARILADSQGALADLEARTEAQVGQVRAHYAGLEGSLRGLAAGGAQQAKAVGEGWYHRYTDGVPDKKDNFWDGNLTYRRAQARGKAARAVSSSYADRIREAAPDLLGQARQQMPADLAQIRQAATAARQHILSQRQAALAQLEQGVHAAMQAAQGQRQAQLEALAQGTRAALGQLREAGAQRVEGLRHAGTEGVRMINERATTTRAQLDEAMHGVHGEATAALGMLRERLQGAPPPDLDALSRRLATFEAEATARLDGAGHRILEGVAGFEQAVGRGGNLGADHLRKQAAAAQQAFQSQTAAVQQRFAELEGRARAGADKFSTQGEGHLRQIVAGHAGALGQVRTHVSGLFAKQLSSASAAAKSNETRIRGELNRIVQGDMVARIQSEAEKAASKEQAGWKKIVAIVAVIVVAVVVAVVLTPIVAGALAGGLVAMGVAAGTAGTIAAIATGAILGGATSGFARVAFNWAQGKELTEGLGQSVVLGAITGGVAGGIAGPVESIGWEGFKQAFGQVLIEVGQDTAKDLLQGDFTWKGLAVTFLAGLAGGGIASVPQVKELQGASDGGFDARVGRIADRLLFGGGDGYAGERGGKPKGDKASGGAAGGRRGSDRPQAPDASSDASRPSRRSPSRGSAGDRAGRDTGASETGRGGRRRGAGVRGQNRPAHGGRRGGGSNGT